MPRAETERVADDPCPTWSSWPRRWTCRSPSCFTPSTWGGRHVPIEVIPLVPSDLLRHLNDAGIASLRATWGGPTVRVPTTAPKAFATVYDGDGMDHRLRPDATVVIDPDQKEPEHGLIYLIQADDGRMLIRLYRGDRLARWAAQSLAPIDDLFVEEGFRPRVLGRVISSITDF
jgi:hypothetical protein